MSLFSGSYRDGDFFNPNGDEEEKSKITDKFRRLEKTKRIEKNWVGEKILDCYVTAGFLGDSLFCNEQYFHAQPIIDYIPFDLISLYDSLLLFFKSFCVPLKAPLKKKLRDFSGTILKKKVEEYFEDNKNSIQQLIQDLRVQYCVKII